jgi:predicted amidohydrolase
VRSRSMIAVVSAVVLVTVWLSAQPPAETRKVRLGLFTAMPAKWELDRNWETFQHTFLAHANEGIEVVVTPECFLDGYAVSAKDWTKEHFAQIAQDVSTSPYIARVRAMAEKYKTAILFGFTERAGSRIYNCALMVDRNGRVVGHYHKTHLQEQDLRFSPGEDLPVFNCFQHAVGKDRSFDLRRSAMAGNGARPAPERSRHRSDSLIRDVARGQ